VGAGLRSSSSPVGDRPTPPASVPHTKQPERKRMKERDDRRERGAVAAEDAQFAVRAVIVHAPEQRELDVTGCRNDNQPHPCRLHRWGRRILTRRGLTERRIEDLITAADPNAPLPAVREEKPAGR
jgi:hypothetical protein